MALGISAGKSESKKKVMDLSSFIIELGEDGIFYCLMKDGSDLNLEGARELVNAMGVLGEGKKYTMLVTFGGFASSDQEAKEFMARKKSNKYLSAIAVITSNVGYRIGTNLFIKIFKPEIPTRLFTDKSEAINWLCHF